MSNDTLLVDIGNTRVKGALAHGGELTALPALATAEHPAFAVWHEHIAIPPRRVVVSNVAGPAVIEDLERHAQTFWQVAIEVVRPARTYGAMTTAYRDPTRLGVDRWIAAYGAFAEARSAVCVVDVGTALTVDVVRGDGTHLGGLIAPGPDLMRLSLTRGTAQLQSSGIEVVAGFADNTQDAISLGCGDAIGGLMDRVAERLDLLEPHEPYTWYLTGGAADTVAARLRVPYRHVPDLVLRGLLAYAGTRA